jgi:hypothetical protein
VSVWATFWEATDDDHTDQCRIWLKRDGIWERRNRRACSCGQPTAPIRYQGSHILPSEDDERAGVVSLALVPSHITRDGRDDGPDDAVTPWPYVRVSVGTEDAILDEQGVAAMYRQLGEWLMARNTRTEPAAPSH